MEIHLQKQGAVTVLKPVGALTATDAAAFAAKVCEAADAALGRVVVDAAGVPFVDSAGLESLLALSEQLNAAGRSLKLCGANPTIREVLELTGLADAFEHFPDVTTGVRSFL
jgi:anti-sigma B factor antagonist